MKTIYTWLQSPIGTDIYGTSSLTGLQFILALMAVLALFGWCAHEDWKERKHGRIEQ